MTPTEIKVLGDPYELHGKIAEGEFCNTYFGNRVDPLEVVTVKMAREPNEESTLALRHECSIVTSLSSRKDVQGTEYFSQFLPQTVVRATPKNVTGPDGFSGIAHVYRWRSGFQFTYEDIAKAYPKGVDSRTAIWMLKRVLDMVGWVHRCGFVHGNVTPQHILVHPRDHGTILAGWSRVTKIGSPLLARSPEYEIYYPKAVWDGKPVNPSMDITMAVRCLFCILGGDITTGTLPSEVPPEFAKLIYAHADEAGKGQYKAAWDLLARVDEVAKIVYGPNKFHPFEMPPKS